MLPSPINIPQHSQPFYTNRFKNLSKPWFHLSVNETWLYSSTTTVCTERLRKHLGKELHMASKRAKDEYAGSADNNFSAIQQTQT